MEVLFVDQGVYVVEAKAFSQNMRIDRGDFAALKGRWETMERPGISTRIE